jgi:hypothetical protein
MMSAAVSSATLRISAPPIGFDNMPPNRFSAVHRTISSSIPGWQPGSARGLQKRVPFGLKWPSQAPTLQIRLTEDANRRRGHGLPRNERGRREVEDDLPRGEDLRW